mgnify:FL=1
MIDAQYVRDDVHPVVDDSLRKPIDALQYYLVLVVVTLALYHVISLFTLLYKVARKNGVSPWYGYVLGGTFYMAFIMLGAGFFVGGFHPNLKAIHDVRVGQNQDGTYGKTHSDRSKALEGLSFTSASLFFAVFVVLLFWRDSICGDTPPPQTQQAASPTASSASTAKSSRFSRGASNPFNVTPLNEQSESPPSRMEMGQVGGNGGGGSSLRFGADRFAAS